MRPGEFTMSKSKENPNSITMKFTPDDGNVYRQSKSGESIFLDLAVANPKAGQEGENKFVSLKHSTERAFIHPKFIKVCLKPGISLSGEFNLFFGQMKEKAS